MEMGQVKLRLPGTAADAVPAAAEPLGKLKDFIFHNSTYKREARPLGVNKWNMKWYST